MKNTTNISRRCVPASAMLCVILLSTIVFGQQSDQNVQATAGASKLEPTSDEQKVKNIMKDFDGHGQRRALAELEKLKTEEARKVLLDVALGRRASESKLMAARRYVWALDDKSQARKLLQSSDLEVCTVGLEGLKGVPIDRELMSQLKTLLQAPEVRVRSWVAFVYLADPNDTFLQEKAEAILRSLDTIDSTADFNKMTAYGGTGDMWSLGGISCFHLSQALAGMKGTKVDLLQQLTPAKAGIARDCVFIARAWLGDISVKKELYRISQESLIPMIRYRAIQPFERYGDRDDLIVLRRVASTDGYHQRGPAPRLFGEEPKEPAKDQDRYYIREYAEYIIAEIQRKGTK